ncbi:MAG: hypothetical protein WB812_02590, partial [Woeseiaceae bacterium]
RKTLPSGEIAKTARYRKLVERSRQSFGCGLTINRPRSAILNHRERAIIPIERHRLSVTNFHDFKTLPNLFLICHIISLPRDLSQLLALPVPTESGTGVEAGRGTFANS